MLLFSKDIVFQSLCLLILVMYSECPVAFNYSHRLIGTIRLRTQATEFVCLFITVLCLQYRSTICFGHHAIFKFVHCICLW
jgi:hypothetical protein